MSLVEKIETLCNTKGLTIAALERAVDLSNGSIRRWETNKPSVDKLAKIADYFNVSVDYLIDRTDNPIANSANDFDASYFKVMKEAKESGISAYDLDLAIDFLKRARERDKEIGNKKHE